MTFGACAPTRLPAATSRAEACNRVSNAGADLGWAEFCTPGGAARCGSVAGFPTACTVVDPAEQPVCQYTTRANGTVEGFPSLRCDPGFGSQDCPPNWQCRFVADRMSNWCFPGPPCSSNADASPATDAAGSD